jgi:hypothetical protein
MRYFRRPRKPESLPRSTTGRSGKDETPPPLRARFYGKAWALNGGAIGVEMR